MELSTASVQDVMSCFWFAVGWGSSYLMMNKELLEAAWYTKPILACWLH